MTLREVVEAVADTQPTFCAELSRALGVHDNVTRRHLRDALSMGYVRRVAPIEGNLTRTWYAVTAAGDAWVHGRKATDAEKHADVLFTAASWRGVTEAEAAELRMRAVATMRTGADPGGDVEPEAVMARSRTVRVAPRNGMHPTPPVKYRKRRVSESELKARALVRQSIAVEGYTREQREVLRRKADELRSER